MLAGVDKLAVHKKCQVLHNSRDNGGTAYRFIIGRVKSYAFIMYGD